MAAGVFSGDIGSMWRGDSGDARPMAGIAVNEAHRNAYRAAPENTPAALMPSPLPQKDNPPGIIEAEWLLKT